MSIFSRRPQGWCILLTHNTIHLFCCIDRLCQVICSSRYSVFHIYSKLILTWSAMVHRFIMCFLSVVCIQAYLSFWFFFIRLSTPVRLYLAAIALLSLIVTRKISGEVRHRPRQLDMPLPWLLPVRCCFSRCCFPSSMRWVLFCIFAPSFVSLLCNPNKAIIYFVYICAWFLWLEVQIAWALYQAANIYLFNDPCSAVYAHTWSHIFKE